MSTVDFQKLKETISARPNSVRGILQFLHNSGGKLPDTEIDEILGIELAEQSIDFTLLGKIFGKEQFTYEGTPYALIREFLNTLQPSDNDIVYDLGSGYGRVVLYCALVNGANFLGIEIVSDRVQATMEIKDKFKIYNADFVEGSAADMDLRDGNIFFLFNPFSNYTLRTVGENLRKVSEEKQIRIATFGGPSNYYFENQPWLSDITPKKSKLQYFESK